MKHRINFFLLIFLFLPNIISAQFKTDAKALEAALEDGMYAEFVTDKGIIITTLEFQKVPITVANFVGLAEGTRENKLKSMGTPFYAGNQFHRVVDNFMIQGGDPKFAGGKLGYRFQDEFHPDLTHFRSGTLSMANAGKDTNASQFFITHKNTKWLDNKHSVFGYVIAGQDVVNLIVQGDKILNIKIIRVGKEAKAFKAEKVFKNAKI